MVGSTADHFFASESSWPFVLREKAMADSVAFMSGEGAESKISLRIFGEAGSGKSFFVRDLICRLSEAVNPQAALYLDFPPSDLEATNVLRKIDHLIALPRHPDRSTPQFVAASLAASWNSKKRKARTWHKSYAYGVARDLSAQIPVVGPFIKAVLPPSLPLDSETGLSEFAALRFLIRLSRTAPVIVAIDNVQFIPQLLRDLLESEFIAAGPFFRSITIERVIGTGRVGWEPLGKGCPQKDIDFTAASLPDVLTLVKTVLPACTDTEVLAGAIHRRSEGNLKSIWFQLKFIAERKRKQERIQSAHSYEEVIQSLSSVEQLVLRLVVFLLGGLSVDQVLHLFRALDLGVEPENVTRAIADLSAIGLLIVNSEHRDKVRVEHDIVSRVVTALTPEEEKVEFRQQLLDALVRMLDTQNGNAGDVTLYDRLLGVAHEFDVRASPALLAHIVNFLSAQHQEERFTYLATVFRDSVCWDVLDVIPAHVIEMLLNSLQRCSLFSFGLVAVGRLRSSTLHHSVAFLYEAKYLVQLFRYEEARSALANAPKSKAGALVDFNIMINQCEDEAAAKVASRVYGNISLATPSEHDLVILRNSGHLFGPEKSRSVLKAAVKGFRRIGSKFGVATALNNLGIADLVVGDLEQAQNNLQTAKRMLEELGSPEVYQALVNLSALALKQMSAADAGRLLREAKSFAPRSLAMDMVMLEYNEAILSLLLGNKICDEGEILRFQNLHRTAARTRDIRFIDTLGWFVSRLELQVRGATETEFSSQIINRVLHSKTLGLEIFVGLNTANASIEAPYLLSPHWRH